MCPALRVSDFREEAHVARLSHFKHAVTLFIVVIALGASARASAECAQNVGQFIDIHGKVDTQLEDGGNWADATLETDLCEGSSIRVGAQSRAAIALVNDVVLRLDENTTIRLVDITEKEEERSLLDMIKGAIHSFSRNPKKLSINSPYLNGRRANAGDPTAPGRGAHPRKRPGDADRRARRRATGTG